jgi:CheY-like chemotaxis protein
MAPRFLAKTKLLLVDDKPANLVALEAVLGDKEYELIRAHSGAEALDRLRAHPDVAVILLDVQMPGMDGLEVARRVKENVELRDIPIIFITAIYTEDPFVKKGYEAGGVDYFGKPFDPEILRLKVGIYSAFRQKANILKAKERQLKESEELLRTGRKLSAVLESLSVGVIIADVEGRICQTNEEVSKILKSVEQSKSDCYGEFLGWWDRDGRLLKEREGPLMRAITRSEASHNEISEIKCFDHTSKSVFVSASPLRGLDGHVVGAVVVLQDVTAHRAIEEDIEKRIIHLVSLGVELEETTHQEAASSATPAGR